MRPTVLLVQLSKAILTISMMKLNQIVHRRVTITKYKLAVMSIVQLKGKTTMFHYVARVQSEIKNKHCINVTYLKKSVQSMYDSAGPVAILSS